MDAIAIFKFSERGTNLTTEIRAGVTTFVVMAYIILVNPEHPASRSASSAWRCSAGTAVGRRGHDARDGHLANAPFALAAGLGINAIDRVDPKAGRDRERVVADDAHRDGHDPGDQRRAGATATGSRPSGPAMMIGFRKMM